MNDSNFNVRISGDSGGFGAAAIRAVARSTRFVRRFAVCRAEFARNIGGSIASMFGAGYLISQVKQTLQWADNIDDLSQRLGVGVEQLQAFEYAAKKSGSSMESIITASRALRRAQGGALKGTKRMPRHSPAWAYRSPTSK